MIRIELPQHLQTLAGVEREVAIEVTGPVTLRSVLDALEATYPVLEGAIRDHVTRKRRPFLRFYACQQDLSHDDPDVSLPNAVATGAEPLVILGAIAGGERTDERTADLLRHRAASILKGGTTVGGPGRL